MITPILSTKLYIPPVRPEIVSRPRLIERLNVGLGHKLTLISAPAGFGKTTLASAWVHQLQESKDIACAWVSLDESDNDPVRFFEYLIAALQQVDQELGQAMRSLLGTVQMPATSSLMTLLINDVASLDNALVLVLDDYHVIESASVHEAVTFLLEHAPPRMHVIITARGEPPLPLARLRARGLVTDVRPEMLRFTLPETGAFMERVLGVTLAADTLSVLETKTEGWVAGLQLAALSMRDKPDMDAFMATFGGDNRHVVDYLIGDVLSRLPDTLRSFLLHTCVLDRLTAPLCNALTGRDDGQQHLRDLEQANLFVIALDERRTWYRYHALFAEFLRATQSDPLTQAAQHRTAADWFAAARLWPDAVRHALAYSEATGEMAVSARIIADAIPTMVQDGALTTGLRWLETLPDDVIETYGELLLYKGWVLVFLGRLDATAECIAILQRRPPADTALRGRFVGLRAFLLLFRGEDAKALKLAQEALTLLADDDLFFRSTVMSILGDAQEAVGDRAGAAETYRAVQRISEPLGHIIIASYAVASLAIVLEMQGKLDAAIDLCQRTAARYVDTRGRPLPTTGVIYLQLALHLYTANALDAAQQALAVGLDLCRQLDLSDYVVDGLLIQALLHAADGDTVGGLAALRQARALAVQAELYTEIDELEALAALLHLARGDLAAAERWATTANLPLADSPDPQRELAYTAYLHLLIVQERLDEAETLLQSLEQFTRKAAYCGPLINVLLLRAVVCQARGDTAGALHYLDQAVTWAAPGGYVRPFVDLGVWIADLLVKVAGRAPTFVRAVLDALAGVPGVEAAAVEDAAAPVLVEPLSERELDVLRLVAAGLSNRQVGEQLFIATSTVRKHLEHIYGKLGVHNRTEAAARARDLGLF